MKLFTICDLLVVISVGAVLVQAGDVDICGNDAIVGNNGTLASPNFPGNYGYNLYCSKTLRPPPGKTIVIMFLDFDIESEESCYYDAVTITVGNSTYGKYCGTNTPPNIITNDDVTITFTTDEEEVEPGFRVYWDIDECATDNGGCGTTVSATCTNSPGSFSCACRIGFTGAPPNCTDIDECLLDIDDCDDDAPCTNFPGSYTCACLPGFRASGSDCIAGPPPGPVVSPSGPASSIVCTPQITIVINQTDLDAMEITNVTNQLYLGKQTTCYPDDPDADAILDGDCVPEFDGTDATFNVSTDKCSVTTETVNGTDGIEYLKFKYIVTKVPTIDEANPVQRYSCAEKEFECLIPVNQNLTSANVTTEILHINSTKVTGESAYQLDFSIDASSPVEVGQNISVAISLVNVVNVTNYQLTATRCSAKPEDGSSEYPIIDCHGCGMDHSYDSPGDITLTKNGVVGDDVEFAFKAFTWTNKTAAEQKIFIHCDVNVCDNVAETCGAAPSCPNHGPCPSKRFRRGLPTSDDTRVSFGPILVKRKSEGIRKSKGIVHPHKIFSVML